MSEEAEDQEPTGDSSHSASKSEKVEINQCPACGQDIDIAGLGPFSKVVCPHCEEAVRVRTRLGNYQIRKMLGEGGMSQVFLAEDLALDRQVALKILHQSLSRDAALMALFEREAKLTAAIHHPNVVKVYTVGSDGGYFYIAMELVDSFSLEERITRGGSLNEREVLDLLHDVAAGLRTAHKQGLIHRDIKPGNILLTESGTGKLVDFGLAVQQGGDDMVEDLWATPFYVPPEKLEGEPDDFQGDIYSLGATFFHALAGKPPFDANTASLEELRKIKSKAVSLTHAGARASVPTIKLIDRMMAYRPEGRPKSYDALLEEIESVQARLPGSKESRVRRQQALSDQKKGPSIPVLIGIWGGVLAVVALAVAAYLNWGGGGGGGLEPGLDTGGGQVVLGAGEKAVTAQYRDARNLLAAGKSGEAIKAFDVLLKKQESLGQPLLGWAYFHRGVADLMAGSNPEEVAPLFQKMRLSAPEAEGETSPAEVTLFRKAGQVMAEPLPVLPSEGSALAAGSAEQLALFAYGLKNWNQQEFDSALAFFDAFEKSTLPSEVAWAEDFKKLLLPFRADAKRLEQLPRPSIRQSESELSSMKKKLSAAVPSFETRGGARDLARARMQRIDSLIEAKKALAAASPEPPPTGQTSMAPTPPPAGSNGSPPAEGEPAPITWTPEAVAEREQFLVAFQPALPMMEDYRFAEARDFAAGFEAQEPAMKRLQEDYLAAIDQAAAFKKQLVTSLAAGTYEGQLIRKEGIPLDCKVVTADDEKLVVDLMFGPNDLIWSKVAPQWMVETAVGDWLQSAPDESNADDWVEAVWFARQTGRRSEAAGLAKAIAPLSTDFSDRWKRLEDLP